MDKETNEAVKTEQFGGVSENPAPSKITKATIKQSLPNFLDKLNRNPGSTDASTGRGGGLGFTTEKSLELKSALYTSRSRAGRLNSGISSQSQN